MADETSSGNAPAADIKENTPPASEQTSSQETKEETVTLSKSEHDRLQKEAAQHREAQSRADKLLGDKAKQERQARIAARKKVAEPEPQDFNSQELSRAKEIITGELLANPDYQKLMSGNKLLARVLTREPWKLLDTDSFVDAQDMADQVLDFLDTELSSDSQNAQPETEDKTPAPAPAASNPGPSAQPTKTEADKERERLAKLPLHERLAAKIQSRVNVKQ